MKNTQTVISLDHASHIHNLNDDILIKVFNNVDTSINALRERVRIINTLNNFFDNNFNKDKIEKSKLKTNLDIAVREWMNFTLLNTTVEVMNSDDDLVEIVSLRNTKYKSNNTFIIKDFIPDVLWVLCKDVLIKVKHQIKVGNYYGYENLLCRHAPFISLLLNHNKTTIFYRDSLTKKREYFYNEFVQEALKFLKKGTKTFSSASNSLSNNDILCPPLYLKKDILNMGYKLFNVQHNEVYIALKDVFKRNAYYENDQIYVHLIRKFNRDKIRFRVVNAFVNEQYENITSDNNGPVLTFTNQDKHFLFCIIRNMIVVLTREDYPPETDLSEIDERIKREIELYSLVNKCKFRTGFGNSKIMTNSLNDDCVEKIFNNVRYLNKYIPMIGIEMECRFALKDTVLKEKVANETLKDFYVYPFSKSLHKPSDYLNVPVEIFNATIGEDMYIISALRCKLVLIRKKAETKKGIFSKCGGGVCA